MRRVVAADRDELGHVETEQRDDGVLEVLRVQRRVRAGDPDVGAASEVDAVQAGMHRVQALTAKAVDTLDDLLDAKKYPNVRLGAARTVAELGIHQHDAETILRKVDEIEHWQRQQDTTQRP